MKINGYPWDVSDFLNKKAQVWLKKKVSSNINELLIFSQENPNQNAKHNISLNDSDFEDEFLDLIHALKTKRSDYIIDSLIEIELQFKKYLQKETDFEIFCSILMNFFKNEWWDELFLKNSFMQNNSILNYFYIKSCDLKEAIRYYKWNKLPLQSKYILYERLIKDVNYRKFIPIILSLKKGLWTKIRQIDFLYSFINRSVSEKLKILNSVFADRIKEINEENIWLWYNETKYSQNISWKDLQKIFSYKSEYWFLEKTLNILSSWDFEIIKSSYKDKIKRFYYNASKFKYNYTFFFYFDKFLRSLLVNDNLSSENRTLIEKEYLFWNSHYKNIMEKIFSKKELEDVILKSYEYLKSHMKFIW